MNDQLDESTGDAGAPAPLGGDDMDVKISNTGQRVRAILVVLIAVGAAVGAIWWYNNKQQQIQRHEDVKAAFQKADTMGYQDFWNKSQIDIKEMKTNELFASRVQAILAEDAMRYAKFMNEECIPIWDKALPEYKGITAPVEYAAELDAVVKAAEELRGVWKSLADDILALEPYFSAKSDLKKAGDAWLGVQTTDDEKHLVKGMAYVNTVQCILGDSAVIFEVKPDELGYKIEDTCMKDRAAWFRRVGMDCMPKLLEKGGEPSDVFKQTLEAYKKAEMPDTKSVFGITDCTDKAYEVFEGELIEKIATAWVNYVKAKNAFIEKIDETLDAMR